MSTEYGKTMKEELERLKEAGLPECRLKIRCKGETRGTVLVWRARVYVDYVVIFVGEDYFIIKKYGHEHPSCEVRISLHLVETVETHIIA